LEELEVAVQAPRQRMEDQEAAQVARTELMEVPPEAVEEEALS
jgi:hypothetical protein